MDDRGCENSTSHEPTPLRWVLISVFFCSLGTGVFWNAISFIAKHAYGFSQTRTLMLYLVMGVIYTVGAYRAGAITRRVEHVMRPRTMLAIVITIQAALCVGPVLSGSEVLFWVVVCCVSLASSFIWPTLESYVTAGRHGPEMRSSLGWFNLVWMTAVGLPLLLMPPILEHHAQWAVGAMSVANLAALVALPAFRSGPGHHDPVLAGANVQEEYPLLLQCARVLLPLSYVLNAALSPILPYRFESIGADVTVETPATATWMFVRVAAMIVMWCSGFWHGRWGTLLLAGIAMTGGFGLIVLSNTLSLMLIGFSVFGIGMGMSYYTALYYAMAVGRAEVDASGTHEALIGAGYAVGPTAGLTGIGGAAVARSAGTAISDGVAIVGLVWAIVGLGAISAFQPYRRARRIRRLK